MRARSFGAGDELASFAFDAGLWRRIGPLYLHVSGARTTTEDWRLLTGSIDSIDFDDTRDHLFDAQAGFVVRNGPHEFGVSAISRRGLDGTVEEMDIDDWDAQWDDGALESADPPEDWSGSVDVEPDDENLRGMDGESERDLRASGLDGIDLFE